MDDRALNVQKRSWWEFGKVFSANTPSQTEKVTKQTYQFEEYPEHHVIVLNHVLSPEECQFFVNDTEQLGYEELVGYRKEYRSNTRVIVPNTQIAEEIWRRVKHLIPSELEPSRRGGVWDAVGLNEQFRFCRYVKGQHFSPHYDADFAKSSKERSFLTFMIYLNDVPAEEGGATVFLKPQLRERLQTINPTTGMVLCFSHDIYHEGEMFNGKAKYLMRSDVMYRRRKEEDAHETSPSDLAIARQKVKEAEEAEAKGEARRAIELYKQAYKIAPELEYNY